MEFYENLNEVMRHFSKTGGFLTVKEGEAVNTMTISWGFIGYIWNKPHFICVVRPQRYTFSIIKKADSFTVSIPFGDMSDELRACGTKSGRDFDKGQVVEFTPARSVDSPIVKGCGRYFECRVNYADAFKGEGLPEIIKQANYSNDYHHFYVGEIVEAYGRNTF